MISTDVQNALNHQIHEDYCSWYFYRSAAMHCRETNLRGLAGWLEHRSRKKLAQATRLSEFVVDRRGHVETEPIDARNGHWDSPLGILDAALERERQLTRSAGDVSDLSLGQGDHATHDFLEHVISDQAHAEGDVQTARDRLKMVGDSAAGLFMFDRSLH